ncbi:hypothetical protein, partial [Novosphingobium sp. CCH12-A3]|uniref:hypothetical protein n=1 Tax=Novosphingobium sp. CCH12-A3 TaxID=1768752 RepID=UPI001E5D4A6D
MVINAHEAEQQQYAAATAIHINTLRILISSLLPLAAKNARNPKLDTRKNLVVRGGLVRGRV